VQIELYLRRASENVLLRRASVFVPSDTRSEMLSSTLTLLIPRAHFADHSRRNLNSRGRRNYPPAETLGSVPTKSKAEAAEKLARSQKKEIRSLRAREKLPVQTTNNDESPLDEKLLFYPSKDPPSTAISFGTTFLSQLLRNDRGERRSPLLDLIGRLANAIDLHPEFPFAFVILIRLCFRERNVLSVAIV